jgi:hypothetical protein
MAKDLIIGAFKNYSFNQIKPWIYSINECGFKGDKVLIAIGASNETISKIADAGFKVISAPSQNGMMFHMERFIHIYNYLKEYIDDYNYVVTTDVRDVIFQKNPSDIIPAFLGDSNEEGCGFYNTISSSEGIKIKDEPWNRENIVKCFGPFFYEQVKDCDVLNVGTLAGRACDIRDLCAALFQMSLNRADWVADQAAYNIMMRWIQYNGFDYCTTLEDAWACNLHVTNKPDQMEQFGPYLLGERPVFENGLVLDGKNKKPYCIVHQYDRVPEMKKYYEAKYGVENVITIRTDHV